ALAGEAGQPGDPFPGQHSDEDLLSPHLPAHPTLQAGERGRPPRHRGGGRVPALRGVPARLIRVGAPVPMGTLGSMGTETADRTAMEDLAVNTIKGLAMDAVQKANSGHPGAPMGMADIAVTLWTRFLMVDPDEPTWADRDRFVLSNGHGSMLLYALLHLAGFPLTLDDIKSFRQWGSHTAGHPEIDHERGIEMTTGPLAQAFGTAVGMALAEAHLRTRLGPELVDHYTYAFVSDGDPTEAISSDSASAVACTCPPITSTRATARRRSLPPPRCPSASSRPAATPSRSAATSERRSPPPSRRRVPSRTARL